MSLGTLPPGATGQWSLIIRAITVPRELADRERETMKAVVSSWRQNRQVIQAQTDAAIGEIHRIGKAVNARIASQRAANDAHNASVQQHWDNEDKYSKSFQNYQFGRAVVQDNDTGGHGTLDYNSADLLVKSDPNRYQYVDTPDFLKGIDY